MLTTLLAFIFTLGLLIVVHEYGHYRVAVACGVKVLRFSVGFGRVLWRHRKPGQDTEFVVCALPLGGYVKMLDEREAPVAPAERHLAFNRKKLWQRAAIVAAGPAANLVLAVALYACVHWIGVQEPKAIVGPPAAATVAERAGLAAGDWVRAFSTGGDEWTDIRSMTDLRWRVTQALLHGEDVDLLVGRRDGSGQHKVTLAIASLSGQEVDARLMGRIGLGEAWREPVLGKVGEKGAGAEAGLKSGDRIVTVDAHAVADASQARDLIRAAGASGQAQRIVLGIDRNGSRFDVPVTPRVVIEGGQRIGRIDVELGAAPEVVTVRYGPWDGLKQAVVQTWAMSALTVKMLGKMVVGQASLKNLSGPVTIADYAGQSARLGIATFLGFLAVVSVSLGVLNLLPLPVLDGGHLMYYLFEALTGRQVSDLWLDRLQRGGVAVMLVMMSLALYNDMARLLGLQ